MLERQVQAAMTPGEREKLYKAIGYQEGSVPTELPEHYVATNMKFELEMLEISVINDSNSKYNSLELNERRILLVHLNGVACELDQRPAALK